MGYGDLLCPNEKAPRRGAAKTAREILNWFDKRVTRIWWGEGKELGCFVPVLEHKGTKHQLFAVYTSGGVELYFQWYRYKQPFNDQTKLLELLDRINQVPGVSLGEETLSRRPSIALSILADPQALEKFMTAYEWYLEQVKAA